MTDDRKTDVIETAVERDIREDKQHQRELELVDRNNNWRAEHLKSQAVVARSNAIMWSIVSIAGVALILGITWIVWQANKGPSDKEQREQQQYSQCVVDRNGTWIPADTDHGPICVANGKTDAK